MSDAMKHTKPSEWGRPPFRYECVGDVDGHMVGYDHFVYDADGEELTNAPNERVAMLFAASADMAAALRFALAALGTEHEPFTVGCLAAERAKAALRKAGEIV